MKRFVNHIYTYVKSPTYRMYVHLYNEQALLDRLKAERDAYERHKAMSVYSAKEIAILNELGL